MTRYSSITIPLLAFSKLIVNGIPGPIGGYQYAVVSEQTHSQQHVELCNADKWVKWVLFL